MVSESAVTLPFLASMSVASIIVSAWAVTLPSSATSVLPTM